MNNNRLQVEEDSAIIKKAVGDLNAWLVEIMLSFSMLLIIVDPTFIPHRYGILDFRIRI